MVLIRRSIWTSRASSSISLWIADRRKILVPRYPGASQVGECHPAGVVYGRVSTWESYRCQVGGTLEAVVVGDEDLTSPNGAVGPVSGAVERESDHAVGDAVLGHHRCDVRMVMLHLDNRSSVALRPRRRQIPRVEIGGDRLRFNPEQVSEVAHGVVESGERLEVLHVPDVLAHESVPAGGEAERRLQFATGCEDGRNLEGKRNRERCIAAGPADRVFGAVEDPHHRVVTRDADIAIVEHEGVGNPVESIESLCVVGDDGFLGQIARRHHPDVARGDEEVMDGCVGEHDSEVSVAGGHEIGDVRVRAFCQQDDWPFARGEQAGFVVADLHNRVCGREVGDHQREGLGGPSLAFPQGRYRRIRRCVTRQVEAAQAFDGNDVTRRDALPRMANRIA